MLSIVKNVPAPIWSIILVAIGLSPVGFIVPYAIFSILELCKGALGSGVSCQLPAGNDYFEEWAVIFEVSCFLLGACLPWGILALAIWCVAAISIVFSIATFLRLKKVLKEETAAMKKEEAEQDPWRGL